MKQHIFSVFDNKAEAFITPFFMPRPAMAERVFREMCNAEDHQFGKHPSDYTLFELGEFDDSNGSVTPCVPKPMFNGLEVKKPTEKNPNTLKEVKNG